MCEGEGEKRIPKCGCYLSNSIHDIDYTVKSTTGDVTSSNISLEVTHMNLKGGTRLASFPGCVGQSDRDLGWYCYLFC